MGCSPRGRKESDTTERLHFLSQNHVSFLIASIALSSSSLIFSSLVCNLLLILSGLFFRHDNIYFWKFDFVLFYVSHVTS